MAETFVYEDNKCRKEFISALFVDIEAQGMGIEKMLIDYAMDIHKKLNLAVYKDNRKAVEIYINRGFKIIKGQLNKDFGSKEYIMEKTL